MTDTQAGPRRRVPVVVPVVLAVALVAGLAWWFVRPLDTAIKASSSVTAAVVGDKVVVSGEVQPAEAGREVIVQVKPTSTWTSAGKGETDSAGGFSVEVPMPAATDGGKASFRVVVAKLGRRVEATSPAIDIKVLKASTITMSAPKSVPKDQRATFTGSVVPPAAGREVLLEQSGDGKSWVATSGKSRTVANGSFSVSTIAASAGPVQFRVVAAETAAFGKAVAKPASVLVEDYKAAGAYYLSVVGPSNEAIIAFNKVNRNTSASLAELKAVAVRASAATKKFADAITNYKGWPGAVQSSVDDLARQLRVEYDLFDQMAVAKSIAAYNRLYFQLPASGSGVAIRQILGLPARPVT